MRTRLLLVAGGITAAAVAVATTGNLSSQDGNRASANSSDMTDPNAVDERGTPLLQQAMLRGKRFEFRRLLKAGADPTRGNRDGQTALHLAAMAITPGWMEVLIDHGASPDVPNTITGATPLYDALRTASDDNIDFLLSAGASVTVKDREGVTPLHQAAMVKNSPAVLKFLEAGADPLAEDRRGATFQDYLYEGDPALLTGKAQRAYEGVAKWLREHDIPQTWSMKPDVREGTAAR
jgi:ankyrin repeat protein